MFPSIRETSSIQFLLDERWTIFKNNKKLGFSQLKYLVYHVDWDSSEPYIFKEQYILWLDSPAQKFHYWATMLKYRVWVN